ncbi:MoaD/ThiS family protein [Polaribacter septentrionalilitoris]|uniref:MoaD/ThiS family protein n=1 Tax=Polaribacter septentrionalilitoris TaxID=2494657 RepID=UPI001356DD32|nr:MoaD/ThiS family protein [Polaribacter septentrionalilitoris]
MKIETLFFGITTDLVNTSSMVVEVDRILNIAEFKIFLKDKFPQLENINSYAVAVNEAYATDDVVLKENDTVAIIPPVSGG